MRACDRESFAGLAQPVEAALHGRVVRAVAEEYAELVAAEAVGRARRSGGSGQRTCEACQQQIAAMVAERVVVGLEAVEVEHDQARRALVARCADHGVEVVGELPAVREPGQGIVHRLHVQLVRQTGAHAIESPQEHDQAQRREQHDQHRSAARELGAVVRPVCEPLLEGAANAARKVPMASGARRAASSAPAPPA